jgi:hypothetical protein
MSEKQMGDAEADSQPATMPDFGGETNPRTRRAMIKEYQETRRDQHRATEETMQRIATNAQQQVAAEIKARDQKIIDQTLAPKWYINGWMYALIFLAAAGALTRVNWLHIHVDPRDVDANFDGIPDYKQVSGFLTQTVGIGTGVLCDACGQYPATGPFVNQQGQRQWGVCRRCESLMQQWQPQAPALPVQAMPVSVAAAASHPPGFAPSVVNTEQKDAGDPKK